ncbi:MAG: hypothetical protein KDD62_08655 [Bdellovibrionales bacterium]|nr:hypothetical protein [Bdellovibrionales bacterium]
MKEEQVSIQDVLILVRRNLGRYFFCVIVSLAIAISLVYYIPKKFKATGQLNIESGYFQNPMVSDLISEVHDPSERISQRMALLRLALTDAFIDTLGERYKVYKSVRNEKALALQREILRSRIEFFSVNRNAFQVSVIGSTAQSAYQMTADVLDHMIETAIAQRNNTLVKTRDALQESLQSMGSALAGSSGPLASFRQSLEQELQELRANLRALKSQLSEQHPDVLKLKKREQSISALLGQSQRQAETNAKELSRELMNPDAKESTQNVYNELLKKLSYLHIAIELNKDKESASSVSVIQQPAIPTHAFFPRLDVFGLVGFVIGNILAFISIVFSEMKRGSFLSPAVAAHQFDVELLGTIPRIPQGKRLPLLETVSEGAVPLSLN